MVGDLGEPDEKRSRPSTLQGGLRIAWFVGLAVFAIQFVVLVQHSWYLWDHFDLTADFGQYSQAWQQIATGHLNPYDTTYPWNYPHYGYPFYQSDFELIMWPLAVLYWVWPHGIDLLIVQDAALAGAGLVAYRWALEHLQVHAPNRRFAVAIATCVGAVLVLQPWTYWAASYDYHSEPLAAFFILLAGRDLWSDRRRGWIFVAVALLCTNVAGSYVVALGVVALISGRQRWRTGLILVAAGAVWLAIVGFVHSGDGAVLSDYAYLDNKTNVNDNVGGIATILSGMLFHPSIAGHVITSRWGEIYKFIGGAGTIGFFSVFGGLFSIIVLAPSALNSSPAFISDIGGSQNIMAVMAVAVGIAMVATWLTRLGRTTRPALANRPDGLGLGSCCRGRDPDGGPECPLDAKIRPDVLCGRQRDCRRARPGGGTNPCFRRDRRVAGCGGTLRSAARVLPLLRRVCRRADGATVRPQCLRRTRTPAGSRAGDPDGHHECGHSHAPPRGTPAGRTGRRLCLRLPRTSWASLADVPATVRGDGKSAHARAAQPDFWLRGSLTVGWSRGCRGRESEELAEAVDHHVSALCLGDDLAPDDLVLPRELTRPATRPDRHRDGDAHGLVVGQVGSTFG